VFKENPDWVMAYVISALEIAMTNASGQNSNQ
jgi:hypothetical protein